jgi:multiple sugar transport system substrate-binding protein
MGKKVILTLLCALLISAFSAGCGGKETGQGADDGGAGGGKNASDALTTIDQPVTLTIAAQLSPELYAQFIEEPVAKKFPNVRLERLLPGGNSGASPQGTATLISAGTIPDIILSLPGWYGQQKLQDLFSDLTPLIKKYNFDLNRYYSGIVETARSYSPEGTIEFLPESMTTAFLMYNKAIFDKFGVAYPKDGMTWEEAIELARKVTRTDNGVQYRGMDVLRDFTVNNTQLSLPFVDQQTKKSVVNSDGWKTYFTMMKSLYDIEGNRPPTRQALGNFDGFAKEQTVAMYVARLENITQLVADNSDLDWDMVTLPVFKELPNTGTQVNTPFFAISPASTKKDAAFKVIAYLLSDEVQLEHNKDGRLTVLKNESIRRQFGSNIKELTGKHIEAALKLTPAKPRPYTIYDNYGVIRLGNALIDVVMSNKDINTALREADEWTNKDIEANMR